MKKKITQLHKDTQHYKENHPFIYTFILGVISVTLITLILFLVYYALAFILSFFPGMNIWDIILIVGYLLGIILFAGWGASVILDEWVGK